MVALDICLCNKANASSQFLGVSIAIKELISLLNLEDKVKIIPVNSDFFSKEYYAERPPSERLITKKLQLRNLNIMRDWKVCLKEYLSDYYKNYL